MNKSIFLKKSKDKGTISIVEPSKNISRSYRIKSEKCMRSAKILFDAEIYENSVSESYYAMYNMLLSLLFRCGVKSENHTATIMLLKELFDIDNKQIKKAKKERIDKQYYVIEEGNEDLTRESAICMIRIAEDLVNEIESFLMDIDERKVNAIRQRFKSL